MRSHRLIFACLLRTSLMALFLAPQYLQADALPADAAQDVDALLSKHQTSNKANVDAEMGKSIFDGLCAVACHQAPPVDQFSPKQWRVVLNTMQTRMQSKDMGPLTPGQVEQLVAYLSQGQ